MSILIKNIILYEPLGAVAGFIEIRPAEDKTHLRLKQSIAEEGLMLSIVIEGKNKVLKIDNSVMEYEINQKINLNYEVFACIVKQVGDEMVSVASGAINLNKIKQDKSIKQIDSAIRRICSVDDQGNGECETCPYRDYFFKQG